MRLSGTLSRTISTSRGLGDQLWDLAGNRPSLDLPFAESKSLVDATTGTNLVTFTRASSGTYVGSDGLIKTATTNLLGYSQDSSQWTVNDSTVTNTTVAAPDNSLTAISFEEALVTSAHYTRISGFSTAVANTKYTMSVYAKAGARDYVTLWADTNRFNAYAKQTFNVANGTLGDSLGVDDKSITSVGNGWYRCSMTFTSGAAPTGTLYSTVLTNNSSSTSNSKPGISGIACYLWGAQLEQSSTVGEYVKTTSTINSAPRFDHNPTTGESLGLLVEESRTNLALYSEDLTQWVNSNLPATANSTTSPDGTLTADRLIPNANTLTHIRYVSIAVTSGVAYTTSMYAKADQYNQVGFLLGQGGYGVAVEVRFNLTQGTYSIITSGTSTTASITSAGNGWHRCSVSSQATGTASPQHQIRVLDETGNAIFTGDNIKGLYVWGVQVEAGSFPTSYIPTTTATVTRSADVASITGSNFSSWYRQDEGTIYSEHMWMTTSDFGTVWGLDDGTGNNETRLIGWNSATDRAPAITVGGTAQIQWTNNSYSANTLYRYGIAYKQNDVASSRNGALPLTDDIVSLPSVTRLAIGSTRSTAFELNGTIKRLTYWPARLANETLQRITQ